MVNSGSRMREFTMFGVVPSVLTPFTRTGEPDLELFQNHVATLDRAGVDGFLVGAESAGATPQEVGRLCAAATASTMKPVLAAVYGDSTVETIELANSVAAANAAALFVAQPHYLFQPDASGLVRMFEELRRTSDLPLVFANTTTGPLDYAGLLALASTGLIDAVAISDAHLAADVLCSPRRLPVLAAIEDLAFVALLLGAETVVTAMAAVFPDDCVAMHAAVKARDFERARMIHERLTRLWHALNHPEELLARLKFAASARGYHAGVPRSPYDALTPLAQAQVTGALAAEGKLPAS